MAKKKPTKTKTGAKPVAKRVNTIKANIAVLALIRWFTSHLSDLQNVPIVLQSIKDAIAAKSVAQVANAVKTLVDVVTVVAVDCPLLPDDWLHPSKLRGVCEKLARTHVDLISYLRACDHQTVMDSLNDDEREALKAIGDGTIAAVITQILALLPSIMSAIQVVINFINSLKTVTTALRLK